MRMGCGAKAEARGGGTVRSLYEAAMREVQADPVAAVTKYQPTWLAALSPGPPRSSAGEKPPPTTRRRR